MSHRSCFITQVATVDGATHLVPTQQFCSSSFSSLATAVEDAENARMATYGTSVQGVENGGLECAARYGTAQMKMTYCYSSCSARCVETVSSCNSYSAVFYCVHTP